MIKPELLIPAGGREQFDAALIYGADAVYLSGKEFSLRAKCDAFSNEELLKAIDDAHAKNVKVFYCINAMPYDYQLPELEKVLEFLASTKIDALIIADPGVLWLAKKICPQFEIHLSTQAHSVNGAAVEFWMAQGVSRINLARELGQEQMTNLIKNFPNMEFEVFVHGAMCLALSGHCLLSAWMNKRPANLGQCTQPCRFEYKGVKLENLSLSVEEKMRQGDDTWLIEQDENYSSMFAPSDLCLIRYMDELIKMQAFSLKLEGRTKSASYVAQVTDVYRTAIDFYAQKNGISPKNEVQNDFSIDDFMNELYNTGSRPLRPFTSGFFLPERKEEKVPNDYILRPIVGFLGDQVSENTWEIKVRSTFKSEKSASVLLPGMIRPLLEANTYSFTNHQGLKVDTLHPGMFGLIHFEKEIKNLKKGIYLRS